MCDGPKAGAWFYTTNVRLVYDEFGEPRRLDWSANVQALEGCTWKAYEAGVLKERPSYNCFPQISIAENAASITDIDNSEMSSRGGEASGAAASGAGEAGGSARQRGDAGRTSFLLSTCVDWAVVRAVLILSMSSSSDVSKIDCSCLKSFTNRRTGRFLRNPRRFSGGALTILTVLMFLSGIRREGVLICAVVMTMPCSSRRVVSFIEVSPKVNQFVSRK